MNLYKLAKIVFKNYESDNVFETNIHNNSSMKEIIGICTDGFKYRIGWKYKINNQIVSYLPIFNQKHYNIKFKIIEDIKIYFNNLLKKNIYNILILYGLNSDISNLIAFSYL